MSGPVQCRVDVVFLVMLWQVLTKGWWLLILGPALLLAFPLLVLLQLLASRSVRRAPGGWVLERLAEAQLLGFLLFMVTLVGFGDTDQVLLFGLRTAQTTDSLTTLSWRLCGAGLLVLGVSTIALIVTLIVRANQHNPAAPAPGDLDRRP